MGRRIETGGRPGAQAPAAHDPPVADDYLGRLVKYVPAEIIALYLTVAGVIPPDATGRPRTTALWVVFFACLALVPVFTWVATTRHGRPPLTAQVVISTLAFPIWVFAIGGPFASLAWYQPWIASVVLAFATTLMGLYQPPPGS
jgi:hypothetical protein